MEYTCKPQLLKIRGKKFRVQGQHDTRQQDYPIPYQKAVVYTYSTLGAMLSIRETSRNSLVAKYFKGIGEVRGEILP